MSKQSNLVHHIAFAECPAVVADADVQRRKAELDTATERLAGVRAGLRAMLERRAEIDAACFSLVDVFAVGVVDGNEHQQTSATGARDALLQERAQLEQQIAMAPAVIAEWERRRVLADLAYLSQVHVVAYAEAERQNTALQAYTDQQQVVQKRLYQDEARQTRGPILEADERQRLHAESRQVAAAAQPTQGALNAARLAVDVAATLMGHYGPTVHHRDTWETIADERAQRARTAAQQRRTAQQREAVLA